MFRTAEEKAFATPFFVFAALLGAISLMDSIFEGEGPLWVAQPEYLIFPLQTIVCGGLLAWFWSSYTFWPLQQVGFTLAVAVLVLVIWILPQELLGFEPRLKGFDPGVFQDPVAYWINLGLRFARLVIVVPLLEEIFWRGWLLRYLIDERIENVPFGSFSWFSFGGVTLCFGLAHLGPDFIPALITGGLYNWVAYRTRSLGCCVLAHTITNLLLGFYIMRTGQWGFW